MVSGGLCDCRVVSGGLCDCRVGGGLLTGRYAIFWTVQIGAEFLAQNGYLVQAVQRWGKRDGDNAAYAAAVELMISKALLADVDEGQVSALSLAFHRTPITSCPTLL